MNVTPTNIWGSRDSTRNPDSSLSAGPNDSTSDAYDVLDFYGPLETGLIKDEIIDAHFCLRNENSQQNSLCLENDVLINLVHLLTKEFPVKVQGVEKEIHFSLAALYAYLSERQKFEEVEIVGGMAFWLIVPMVESILQKIGIKEPWLTYLLEEVKNWKVLPNDLDIRFKLFSATPSDLANIGKYVNDFFAFKLPTIHPNPQPQGGGGSRNLRSNRTRSQFDIKSKKFNEGGFLKWHLHNTNVKNQYSTVTVGAPNSQSVECLFFLNILRESLFSLDAMRHGVKLLLDELKNKHCNRDILLQEIKNRKFEGRVFCKTDQESLFQVILHRLLKLIMARSPDTIDHNGWLILLLGYLKGRRCIQPNLENILFEKYFQYLNNQQVDFVIEISNNIRKIVDSHLPKNNPYAQFSYLYNVCNFYFLKNPQNTINIWRGFENTFIESNNKLVKCINKLLGSTYNFEWVSACLNFMMIYSMGESSEASEFSAKFVHHNQKCAIQICLEGHHILIPLDLLKSAKILSTCDASFLTDCSVIFPEFIKILPLDLLTHELRNELKKCAISFLSHDHIGLNTIGCILTLTERNFPIEKQWSISGLLLSLLNLKEEGLVFYAVQIWKKIDEQDSSQFIQKLAQIRPDIAIELIRDSNKILDSSFLPIFNKVWGLWKTSDQIHHEKFVSSVCREVEKLISSISTRDLISISDDLLTVSISNKYDKLTTKIFETLFQGDPELRTTTLNVLIKCWDKISDDVANGIITHLEKLHVSQKLSKENLKQLLEIFKKSKEISLPGWVFFFQAASSSKDFLIQKKILGILRSKIIKKECFSFKVLYEAVKLLKSPVEIRKYMFSLYKNEVAYKYFYSFLAFLKGDNTTMDNFLLNIVEAFVFIPFNSRDQYSSHINKANEILKPYIENSKNVYDFHRLIQLAFHVGICTVPLQSKIQTSPFLDMLNQILEQVDRKKLEEAVFMFQTQRSPLLEHSSEIVIKCYQLIFDKAINSKTDSNKKLEFFDYFQETLKKEMTDRQWDIIGPTVTENFINSVKKISTEEDSSRKKKLSILIVFIASVFFTTPYKSSYIKYIQLVTNLLPYIKKTFQTHEMEFLETLAGNYAALILLTKDEFTAQEKNKRLELIKKWLEYLLDCKSLIGSSKALSFFSKAAAIHSGLLPCSEIIREKFIKLKEDKFLSVIENSSYKLSDFLQIFNLSPDSAKFDISYLRYFTVMCMHHLKKGDHHFILELMKFFMELSYSDLWEKEIRKFVLGQLSSINLNEGNRIDVFNWLIALRPSLSSSTIYCTYFTNTIRQNYSSQNYSSQIYGAPSLFSRELLRIFQTINGIPVGIQNEVKEHVKNWMIAQITHSTNIDWLEESLYSVEGEGLNRIQWHTVALLLLRKVMSQSKYSGAKLLIKVLKSNDFEQYHYDEYVRVFKEILDSFYEGTFDLEIELIRFIEIAKLLNTSLFKRILLDSNLPNDLTVFFKTIAYNFSHAWVYFFVQKNTIPDSPRLKRRINQIFFAEGEDFFESIANLSSELKGQFNELVDPKNTAATSSIDDVLVHIEQMTELNSEDAGAINELLKVVSFSSKISYNLDVISQIFFNIINKKIIWKSSKRDLLAFWYLIFQISERFSDTNAVNIINNQSKILEYSKTAFDDYSRLESIRIFIDYISNVLEKYDVFQEVANELSKFLKQLPDLIITKNEEFGTLVIKNDIYISISRIGLNLSDLCFSFSCFDYLNSLKLQHMGKYFIADTLSVISKYLEKIESYDPDLKPSFQSKTFEILGNVIFYTTEEEIAFIDLTDLVHRLANIKTCEALHLSCQLSKLGLKNPKQRSCASFINEVILVLENSISVNLYELLMPIKELFDETMKYYINQPISGRIWQIFFLGAQKWLLNSTNSSNSTVDRVDRYKRILHFGLSGFIFSSRESNVEQKMLNEILRSYEQLFYSDSNLRKHFWDLLSSAFDNRTEIYMIWKSTNFENNFNLKKPFEFLISNKAPISKLTKVMSIIKLKVYTNLLFELSLTRLEVNSNTRKDNLKAKTIVLINEIGLFLKTLESDQFDEEEFLSFFSNFTFFPFKKKCMQIKKIHGEKCSAFFSEHINSLERSKFSKTYTLIRSLHDPNNTQLELDDKSLEDLCTSLICREVYSPSILIALSKFFKKMSPTSQVDRAFKDLAQKFFDKSSNIPTKFEVLFSEKLFKVIFGKPNHECFRSYLDYIERRAKIILEKSLPNNSLPYYISVKRFFMMKFFTETVSNLRDNQRLEREKVILQFFTDVKESKNPMLTSYLLEIKACWESNGSFHAQFSEDFKLQISRLLNRAFS